MLVLYSKEQIDKEARIEYDKFFENKKGFITTQPLSPKPFDADWGIVAILGQTHPDEEPMKPITMMRNALGIVEGGSGTKLDREAYQRSVDFWSKNATIK